MKTTPNVFIIESLKFEDEKRERFEGKFLSHILNLDRDELNSNYYYIRTKKELEKVLEIFDNSKLRYLHISCHGNSECLATTLDRIGFEEFANLIGPHLNKKRLFISACEAVNIKLARSILGRSNCYSLIGFGKEISYSDAAVIWASFYHLMYSVNPRAMERAKIREILREIKQIYGIQMKFFTKYKDDSIREIVV